MVVKIYLSLLIALMLLLADTCTFRSVAIAARLVDKNQLQEMVDRDLSSREEKNVVGSPEKIKESSDSGATRSPSKNIIAIGILPFVLLIFILNYLLSDRYHRYCKVCRYCGTMKLTKDPQGGLSYILVMKISGLLPLIQIAIKDNARYRCPACKVIGSNVLMSEKLAERQKRSSHAIHKQ